MKVLLLQTGKPEDGSSAALSLLASCLEGEDIVCLKAEAKDKTEGCVACGKCYKRGRCVKEDYVTGIAETAKEADALIVASPLLYGELPENTRHLMERLFRGSPKNFSGKPAAAIVFSRGRIYPRAVQELYKYFERGDMLVITSQKGNCMTAGKDGGLSADSVGQIEKTAVQMKRVLACLRIAKENGIEQPDLRTEHLLDFIR